MHNVLRLFVNGHNPGDEVSCDEVHAAEVRSAPALVELDPGAEDHRRHLQHGHRQAQESAQLEGCC